MRVLLAGAFGQGNPGDEALLGAFLRAIPGAEVTATSGDPRSTIATHGCAAVRPGDRVAVALALRDADAIVIGGGTIFKRLHPTTGRRANALLASTLGLVTAARALRRPVAAVGVGAGDLETPGSRRLTRAIVRRVDLVVLRDEESALSLERAGARPPFRVGADPVWSLVDSREPAPSERSDRVVVAISRFAATDAVAFSAALAAALRDLARHEPGLRFDVQPWQVDDLGMAVAIADGVPAARIVDPPPSFEKAVSDYRAAQAVIGLRFHALVAAAAASTPFLAVAHEAKLAAIARRLDQRAVLADALSLARVPEAVRAAVAAGPARRQAVASEIRAAEDGFRLLRLVLNGGDDDLATLQGLALVPDRWLP